VEMTEVCTARGRRAPSTESQSRRARLDLPAATNPSPASVKDIRRSWPPKVDVLGVQLSATTYEEATAAILEAASGGVPGVVTCQPVHGVVLGAMDKPLGAKMNSFDMITPDGQPVRWAMNLLHRTALRDRVCGPELTLHLCRSAAERGVGVYLYGGTPPVAAALRDNLLRWYPGLRLAGTESPPFRPLTPEEDEEMVQRINASGAGIVLVGLGCPKQDLFAYDHRDRIRAVQVCVGAAFDFHAGHKRQAPGWMQRSGLGWLFRLLQEPRRLWRRYLFYNTVFLGKLAVTLLRNAVGHVAR